MFREMRRSRQRLDYARAEEILRRAPHGVLAVLGDGGYPYAVPLSFAYEDGHIYIHCARAGHKLDALRRCAKASFCAVERDAVVPEEFTTRYVSAIAVGRARELASDAEKRAALRLLCRKYCPALPDEAVEAAIERDWAGVNILDFEVESLSGKQARELIS